MKTYWDLSELERGRLSQDDVSRYVDAELMIKGVLKAPTLVLEEEPPPPAPTTRRFVVRFGKSSYAKLEVALPTREAAAAFLELGPRRIVTRYVAGSESVDVLDESDDDAEIVEALVFTPAEYTQAKATLERALSIRAENKARREAHERAVREQDNALKGLWDDWRAQRGRIARLDRVVETFRGYVQTAGGDETIAARFLRKVHTEDEIADAADLHGITIPDAPADASAPTAPAPPSSEVTF